MILRQSRRGVLCPELGGDDKAYPGDHAKRSFVGWDCGVKSPRKSDGKKINNRLLSLKWYRLREKCAIDSKTIRRLKAN